MVPKLFRNAHLKDEVGQGSERFRNDSQFHIVQQSLTQCNTVEFWVRMVLRVPGWTPPFGGRGIREFHDGSEFF
jgi:hypothetical protein